MYLSIAIFLSKCIGTSSRHHGTRGSQIDDVDEPYCQEQTSAKDLNYRHHDEERHLCHGFRSFLNDVYGQLHQENGGQFVMRGCVERIMISSIDDRRCPRQDVIYLYPFAHHDQKAEIQETNNVSKACKYFHPSDFAC